MALRTEELLRPGPAASFTKHVGVVAELLSAEEPQLAHAAQAACVLAVAEHLSPYLLNLRAVLARGKQILGGELRALH